MNRLEKAAKEHMEYGFGLLEGACSGLLGLHTGRIIAACDAEELQTWSTMAKKLGKDLIDWGSNLAGKSGSGIDELATSAARYLGSKGGTKGGSMGGKARMKKLTTEQRRELGRLAAKARWAKAKAKNADQKEKRG